MIDTLVVGAGWSGLTAAARLAARGYEVVVVEKSRGPGGRSATRREGGYAFDHGAQYLTARSDAFRRQVSAWAHSGLLATWRPRLEVFGRRPSDAGSAPAQRWVGVPGMNAVPRRLARGIDCRWQWRVHDIERADGAWRITADDGRLLSARSLLLTAPPNQTAELIGAGHPLEPRVSAVAMQPCWALMLGFESAPAVDFDAAFVNEGALSWIARNDVRPGRNGGAAWLAHARATWSLEHLEEEPEPVAEKLHRELAALVPGLGEKAQLRVAHRWRFAMAEEPLSGPILARDDERLVIAGDWCAGQRIEGAWISGVAAARRLKTLLY